MSFFSDSKSTLEDRRLVWEALSELFLDTDTTLFEKYIIEKLAYSPYSIAEIEEIFIQEVTPVCMWNMFWWEWVGFNPEWLESEILKKKRSPFRVLYWPLFPFVKYKLRHSGQWKRIVKNVLENRNASNAEQA